MEAAPFSRFSDVNHFPRPEEGSSGVLTLLVIVAGLDTPV